MQDSCQVCGSTTWRKLPDPVDGRAVTTAGRIIDESLGKSQCGGCGFVQRINARFLGHTEYYEQDYAKYYERPGTAKFHLARYQVLVDWMVSVLGPIAPSRILDVGCGQGWAMEVMRACYPKAVIEGLEPSLFNSQVARAKGFLVHETRATSDALSETKYDLVYSNNVIQHVTDARAFIDSMKGMVKENGAIIITCPDATLPNIEVLWSDQNFSFLPEHLIRICDDAGFSTIEWFASPPSPSVPPAQMLVISNDANFLKGHEGMQAPNSSLEEIYQAKCDYLGSFQKIDDFVCAATTSHERVFNFGSSYWSSILAAYCRRYWLKVAACLVEETDGLEPQFLDKRVLRFDSITPTDHDAMVLGTSPATHEALGARLSSAWKNVITWDQFLSY